ncbi:EutP/PduV family microcompartment system protein [Oceanotoga teriensis]|uniref:EutP/PduV family microcompartment system protein n=1 Tax=Oceanotoga teriensis TaxID=515440 RepID=UPI002713D84A|nr:EutP/PduV family microcompartment system protein [Oceanotoga teriensis]MDO7976860.1 EutP/PduV family microcompartment system protein [Oceanotoga teriensis]
MKKIMLIGKTGSGKTTFCQAYKNQELIYKKTQAIDFMDELIDTPGEYIENRVYYKALIVTSNECDIICFLNDPTSDESFLPPGFASMFNKETIGLITKIEKSSNENIKKAEENLKLSGVEKIFKIDNFSKKGFEKLENYINSLS